MRRYFKESENQIYEVFESGKYLLIHSISIDYIGESKYLEKTLTNHKYLKDSILKVCTEISKEAFDKMLKDMEKLFNKDLKRYNDAK